MLFCGGVGRGKVAAKMAPAGEWGLPLSVDLLDEGICWQKHKSEYAIIFTIIKKNWAVVEPLPVRAHAGRVLGS